MTAVGDVRSQPYSRYVPQYSRDALEAALADAGIAYVFLGKELGRGATTRLAIAKARSSTIAWRGSRSLPRGSAASCKGSQRYRIALLCAEKDPWIAIGRCSWPAGFSKPALPSATFTPTARWRATRPWNRVCLPPASCRKATSSPAAKSSSPTPIAFVASGLPTRIRPWNKEEAETSRGGR